MEKQQIPPQYAENANFQQPSAMMQMQPVLFGSYSQPVQCSYCGTRNMTTIVKEAGAGTWLLCIGICCVTGCLGPIAFCLDSTQDTTHFCSNCGNQVGIKKVMNL